MPMVDVQRRFASIFRIRFGERNGKGYPTKLTDAIRVTSANAEVVDAFVEVYGGERKAWQGQWEAKLPTTELSIFVLPGQSISQWWERYRGSVCERRCTGETETKSNKPCMCDPDPILRTANKDDCSPTTRVSVLCPDVRVVGSGMFVCHGLIAAETLPQSIAVAEAALSRGLMVPAVLRVVEFKGRTHFIVPQIEVLGISLNELAAAADGNGHGMLPQATHDAVGPRFQPVGALPAAPAPPIAEQMAAMDRPYVPQGRANAAEPIRPTGLAPRTAAEARTSTAVIDAESEEVAGEDGPPAVPDEQEVTSAVPLAPAPGGVADVPPQPVNRVAIAAREAGLDDDGRHDLAEWVSAGRTRSSALLDASEQSQAIDAARQIKAGTAALKRNAEGGLELRDPRFGWPAEDPVTGSANPDTVGDVAGLTADEIVAMKGPALMAALRERGLPLGGKVEEVRARLMEACGVTGEDSF